MPAAAPKKTAVLTKVAKSVAGTSRENNAGCPRWNGNTYQSSGPEGCPLYQTVAWNHVVSGNRLEDRAQFLYQP